MSSTETALVRWGRGVARMNERQCVYLHVSIGIYRIPRAAYVPALSTPDISRLQQPEIATQRAKCQITCANYSYTFKRTKVPIVHMLLVHPPRFPSTCPARNHVIFQLVSIIVNFRITRLLNIVLRRRVCVTATIVLMARLPWVSLGVVVVVFA